MKKVKMLVEILYLRLQSSSAIGTKRSANLIRYEI